MNEILRKLGFAYKLFQKGGLQRAKRFVDENYRRRKLERLTERWLKANGNLGDDERSSIVRTIHEMRYKPLISIVLPVYNVDEQFLRLCIESVFRQLYRNWELCIADDCSTRAHIREVLDEYARKDSRVKVIYRAENGHISAASNSALELVSGEFTALLDHDDELAEDALFRVANEINEHPSVALIYSDADKIDPKGQRSDLSFKPDWSRDLFYSLNLVTHLSIFRTEILRKIGGFRTGFEGSQDYDLTLRVLELIDDSQIRHIPRILYHWRAIPGSIALSGDEKPYAHERARTAIREHFARISVQAEVEATKLNLHRACYRLPMPNPKISIILFGGGDSGDTQEVRNRTSYPSLEILSADDAASGLSDALNRAAALSTGEIICFIEGSLRPMDDAWLSDLAGFAWQDEIGAVGPKILSRENLVIGSALVVGTSQIVSVAHRDLPAEVAGRMCRNLVTSNFSALSILGLVTRREIFDGIGGFDSEGFQNHLFDADYCLRLRERGLRIVSHPHAELNTRQKSSLLRERRSSGQESALFRDRWAKYFGRDPFYNTNFP